MSTRWPPNRCRGPHGRQVGGLKNLVFLYVFAVFRKMEVIIIGTRLMNIYYLLCLSTALQETSKNGPLGRVISNSKLFCQLTNHFRRLSQGGQPFKPCLSWSIQLSKISSLMIEWLYLLRARRRGEGLACEFRRNYENRIPTSNIGITKSEFLLS